MKFVFNSKYAGQLSSAVETSPKKSNQRCAYKNNRLGVLEVFIPDAKQILVRWLNN